jgi:hypothetical protein
MMSQFARLEGTWNPETRTLTFDAEVPGKERPYRYREIIQTLEDGSRVYRNLVPTADGGELEMIRITYRKRK